MQGRDKRRHVARGGGGYVERGCARQSDESAAYLFSLSYGADCRDIVGSGGKSRFRVPSGREIAAMRSADYSRFIPGAPAGTS